MSFAEVPDGLGKANSREFHHFLAQVAHVGNPQVVIRMSAIRSGSPVPRDRKAGGRMPRAEACPVKKKLRAAATGVTCCRLFTGMMVETVMAFSGTERNPPGEMAAAVVELWAPLNAAVRPL